LPQATLLLEATTGFGGSKTSFRKIPLTILADFETQITGFTNSVSNVSTNRCESVNGTPLDYVMGDASGKQ